MYITMLLTCVYYIVCYLVLQPVTTANIGKKEAKKLGALNPHVC
jgi:hypothetical protein